MEAGVTEVPEEVESSKLDRQAAMWSDKRADMPVAGKQHTDRQTHADSVSNRIRTRPG